MIRIDSQKASLIRHMRNTPAAKNIDFAVQKTGRPCLSADRRMIRRKAFTRGAKTETQTGKDRVSVFDTKPFLWNTRKHFSAFKYLLYGECRMDLSC